MRKMTRGVSLALITTTALLGLLTPALQARDFSWSLPGLGAKTTGKWELQQLTSAKGAPEIFKKVDKPASLGLAVEIKEETLAANAAAVRVTLRNDGKNTLFLKSDFAITPPLLGYRWWNGYANRIQTKFDPEDVSLTRWFPANAALGETGGVSLGLDPIEVYSRVDSGQNARSGELTLAMPIVLAPGEQRTTSFVVTSFPTQFGYRDAIQNYYNLFPNAYRPADVHPSVISSQSTYLFWKPRAYNMEHSDDMIRRFTGGHGGWEWCYAPFLRGGDWATTYEWSVGFGKTKRGHVDRQRKKIQEKMAQADALDVAPMYYVNVLWAERTLMEQHFPEALSNPRVRNSWGNEAVFGLYPWGNRYGDLFAQSIRDIAQWYPQSYGIGWDSAFGHQRSDESVAGVLKTDYRSFDKGEQFALNGVAYTHLLDLNRSFKAGDYQRANAVNLKLVSPYFLGARSDAALYEGHPAETPNRLMRFEVMRANLGSPKALSWHKNMVPGRLHWVKWDSMDEVQIRDGMRQIYQDVLFLSYFWGGVPSPGMPTLGVPFVFEQVPTLIELVRKGWQPVPAVAGSDDLLFARYGQGAGAVIAVINPDFQPRETGLSFPARYWENRNLLLARRDGEPLGMQLDSGGTSATLTVPARSVLLLDVVALIDSSSFSNDKDVVTATPAVFSDGRSGWDFTLETYAMRKWDFSVAAPEPGFVSTAVQIGRKKDTTPAGEPVAFTLNSEAWPDDVQEMNRRTGNFSIVRNPAVSLATDAAALKALDWFASAGGGTNLQFEGVSEPTRQQISQMMERWFFFYTSNALKHTESVQTQAQAQTGAKGVSVVFRLGAAETTAAATPDAVASLALPDSGNGKATVAVAAASEADLITGVNRLLALMDTAFPYYGHLLGKDETLKFAGLAGAVLEEKMESDFILKPTFSERWGQHFDGF